MRLPPYTPTSFFTRCKAAEADRALVEAVLDAVWADKIELHGSVRAAIAIQLEA